jgi:PAS domain S-box-containing protein
VSVLPRNASSTALRDLEVLYVEDEESVREQLAQFLRRRVGRLHLAENGQEGLEAFRRFRPDVVISDIRMPVMDGLAMAERIKQDASDAPVILTSAHSDIEFLLRAIDVGVDKYVLKPVKVDMLVDALERSAAMLSARRELRLAAAVLQAISEGVVIASPDGTIVAVNPAFVALTGCTEAAAIGRNVADFEAALEGSEPGALPRLAAVGSGKGELGVRRKDGGVLPAWVTAATVPGKDGEPAYIVLVLADLTARKAAEEALKRVNEQLEARVRERTAALEVANDELQSFNYSVSHDLSAPLRRIDGFAYILEEHLGRNPDPGALKLARRIRRGAASMQTLIDDLLRLSQVSQTEVHRRPCSLSTLAAQVAGELRAQYSERTVECVVAPNLEVSADPRLLRIVLDNLLGNAWKFTGRNPAARIEVGAKQTDGRFALFVRDNGVGFDMAHSEKLLAPFARAHSSNEFEGTGIGLAIVDRIVRRHGGRLWFESAPDQGATFYFTLA